MITAIKDGDGILSVSILCESFSMFAAPSSMRSLPPSLTSLEINVAQGHPPRQVKYVISSIVKSFVLFQITKQIGGNSVICSGFIR